MLIIISKFILSILYLSIVGFGTTGFLSRFFSTTKKIPGLFFLMPAIGYSLSQLLFWLFYAWLENSKQAFFFTSLLLSMLSFLFVVLYWRQVKLLLKESQKAQLFHQSLPLLLSILGVLIFSFWPYLFVGEGSYYHSGNEDFFDGLNGGEAYYNNIPFKEMTSSFHEEIKLQYSSQAFWRVLFSYHNPMDSYLLQDAVNIILTMLGCFWLLRHACCLSKNLAISVGIAAILSNVYFTTFLAGHIGSFMYGSIAPFFLGIALLWVQNTRLATKTIPNEHSQFSTIFQNAIASNLNLFFFALIFAVFIQNTYPGPLYFVIIPLIVYGCHELFFTPMGIWRKISSFYQCDSTNSTKTRWHWGKIIITIGLVTLATTIGTILLWELFEPARVYNIARGSQESWRISRYKEMLLIFWGIAPSDLVGAPSLGPLLFANKFFTSLAYFLCFIFFLITLFGVFTLSKHYKQTFFIIYTPFWFLFAIMMYHFYGSGYYYYKFIYVNFFLIISCFSIGIWTLLRSTPFPKIVASCLLFFFLSFNILYDLWRQVDLVNRPYHNVEDVRQMKTELKKVPSIALSIPNELNELVIKKMLEYENISLHPQNRSKYLLKIVSNHDVINNNFSNIHTIYTNDTFEITTNPSKNVISISSQYKPDKTFSGPIRWISDKRIEKSTVIRKLLTEALNDIPEALLAKTYFDIKNGYFVQEFHNIQAQKEIRMETNPSKADLFFRLNNIPGLGNVRCGDFYHPVEGEKTIWKNSTFTIVSIPQIGRKVRFPPTIDPFELSNIIRSLPGKVYVDIPPTESLYHYLISERIDDFPHITETPREAAFFIQMSLPPNANSPYYGYFQPHQGEKLIWESIPDILPSEVMVKIVQIPFEGRIKSHAKEPSLPYESFLKLDQFEAKFSVTAQNIDDSLRYLNLVIGSGPSIGMATFMMDIENRYGEILHQFQVEGNSFISIPLTKLNRLEDRVIFRAKNISGKSLMPYDPRILDIKVQFAELSPENQLSSEALSVINYTHNLEAITKQYSSIAAHLALKKDIISKQDMTNGLMLGGGWYDLEKHQGDVFRWIAKQAMLVYNGIRNKHINVTLDVEPGPSSNGVVNLEIVSSNGDILQQLPIHGSRQTVNISLPKAPHDNQQFFWLRPKTENITLKGDARLLNLRVFSIKLQQE